MNTDTSPEKKKISPFILLIIAIFSFLLGMRLYSRFSVETQQTLEPLLPPAMLVIMIIYIIKKFMDKRKK